MGFVGSDLWRVRQKWGRELILWAGSTVVVTNKYGKIWLGKRVDNDTWGVAGGHFELGDSAETCAQREVKEELGLDVAELTMIGVITDPKLTYIPHPNGDEVQSPSFVFHAVVHEDFVALDEEHSLYEWIDLDSAIERVKSNDRGYSPISLAMYKNWLHHKEFQIR